MKRNMICIICPRGCPMIAETTENGIVVTGHTCPKGEQYAIDECTHPMRTVTSIVSVSNRPDTMVSVKTAAPIPKEKMFDAMEVIRGLKVEAPVSIGDVLCRDVFGTEVIATKNIG